MNYIVTPSQLVSNASCYGSGSIVSVGEKGAVAYKTVGATWSDIITLNSNLILNGVACGTVNGYVTFVAVGDNGNIYYSQDGGGKWTFATSSSGISMNLEDVAFGNGLFVAVGNNGDGSQVLLTSSDGDKWNDRTPVDQGRMLTSIDYMNGRFIAGAYDQSGEYVYESADGLSWMAAKSLDTTTATSIVGVDYCCGFYLALDSAGTIRKSVDGSTWIAVDSIDNTQTYAGIANDGKRFVLLTQGGSVFATSDAETWSILPSMPTSTLSSIIYSGLEWAAGFDGGSFIVSRKVIVG